ncbi:M20/M25/M40 family metallo-hydrolase [Pelovirga terrestris]|uniref:M20/M25/M40 family metallo-hydrolase n=1 Tax=Pelovirga terrestris TaxID=2771352 RepID=A0A8J6UHP4_9BACT|nr:M20/M25/M40 family metallo-hydrolase [Pelovirga terrestris]MBD1399630.1 M20/M25/M40 family metallo-hydrolase [Pelovirga terrestris]
MTNKASKKNEYQVSKAVRDTFADLGANPEVNAALEFIKADHVHTLNEQKEICAISAPTFEEKSRAEDYLRRFKELGLDETRLDAIGNVLGMLKGCAEAPKLVVAAHLDTVFPAGTDTKVVEKEGIFHAPGIADDTRGLAEILGIIRTLKQSQIQLLGDILFVGNVGEEGLGDLRGTKQLFNDFKDIDGFITIDGTGVGSITYRATGSHRYRVTFKGPGGHSYLNFGLPSAIHAAGRAIALLADLSPPKDPLTTFTVGTINGGTSVNTIAAQAEMLIDIRSNGREELLQLGSDILSIIKAAAAQENTHCNSDQLTVDIELLGDRPAGFQSPDEPIVQAAYAAGKLLGINSQLGNPGSTDANIPISLGIPAISIGRGGTSGNIHTTNEWFDPTGAYLGPQKTLLTILALVGVKGTCPPLLKKSAANV